MPAMAPIARMRVRRRNGREVWFFDPSLMPRTLTGVAGTEGPFKNHFDVPHEIRSSGG